MSTRTINPYTEQVLREYRAETLEEVRSKIAALGKAQQEWKRDINTRLEALREVKKRWASNLTELSELMSSEMGKSISQSEAEVKKCALLLDYVIENSQELLAPEPIKTEARKSYVRFDPVGVVLLVMPWNFPAWQVMRAAIPALAAGNAVILKHASIVSGSSLKLEEILGLDVFKSAITSGAIAQSAIKYVDGVSFTGSTEVGTRIAEEAGKNLKKMVLELGGSDPFIVLDNANLEEAIKNCVFARLQNNGQSCIASKRFIVHEKVYNDFYKGMKEGFSKIKIGDPLNKTTFLGPLSSREQKETVQEQVKRLRSMGQVEQLATGLKGNFEPPTIVKTDALFDEEVFGPVAVLKKFKTYEDAIRIANETPFGLVLQSGENLRRRRNLCQT